MSIFSFISKLTAIWAADGAMFEEMADVYQKHRAAQTGATEPAKPPSETVSELRKVIGAKPLTDDERRWMDRASGR